MSNNLASQGLLISNRQMEPVSDKKDPSILNMPIGMTGPMPTNPSSHHFAVSNQQMGSVDPSSYIPVSQNLMASNKQLVLNQKVGEMDPMWNNHGSQKMLLPTKRKAGVEPLSSNSLPQHSSAPNKRVAQMEPPLNSPGSSQSSALNKRSVQMQSMPSTPGSSNLPNKRMMRNESISSKSGTQRVQTPKSRTATMDVSPKVRTESFEAVRSKMRETLAAALSVVSQDQENAANEGKNSPHEAVITSLQAHVDSHPAESTASAVEADVQTGSATDTKLNETTTADKPKECQSTSLETAACENVGNTEQTGKSDGQQSQFNYVLPDGDGPFTDSFFIKDELLQGNGLSWAWDMEVSEMKEAQTTEKPNLVQMDVGGSRVSEMKEDQTAEKPKLVQMDVGGNKTEQVVSSPQDLAFKIEAELFKLFGGVNKKYKEKGRSLMFNLKDRSNPELGERVISGEISPERLCSMTPEELASKELSQWRMAKAEELAQMIVLPDSDVDIRRLVKKTHKGEYQVDFEQDDGVSVEVSVGSTSFSHFRPKKEVEAEGHRSSEADEVKDTENVEGEKSSPVSPDPACSLTIPADGPDFMQGLIVDEFKDEGFLPPIVSLDEFMESLNAEPPFENLPVDAGQVKPLSDKENSETGGEKMASDSASADPVNTEAERSDQSKVKTTELELKVKTSESSAERKISPPASVSLAERVWEGGLQLTISSLVTVAGLFRSGEKTSTKEWPSSIEIKGRVRLDAFEKFLLELPMSRSRAVMVVQFVLKNGSSEHDRASLSEAVDSYILDERLGFGEPIPGVELYFCPPQQRILEMLSRHLSADQTDILKSTDIGLIGVVVWRRAHLSSAISPNSSSHHKHHKKQFSSRRQDNVNGNTNSNFTSKSFGQTHRPHPPDNNDDDDDIPPGFGPGAAARDEDDLPEFNFSGNLNSSGQKLLPHGLGTRRFNDSSRPVDQMRELVYKYGQTASVPGIRPLKDDDDDIPEWQPQVPQQYQPHPSLHSIQQPLRSHMVNQHLTSVPSVQVGPPIMPMQQPLINVIQNPAMQNGVRWVQPPGLRHNVVLGQNYGMQWRQDAPRSSGF